MSSMPITIAQLGVLNLAGSTMRSHPGCGDFLFTKENWFLYPTVVKRRLEIGKPVMAKAMVNQPWNAGISKGTVVVVTQSFPISANAWIEDSGRKWVLKINEPEVARFFLCIVPLLIRHFYIDRRNK
jgi:hypothetical protein